MLTPRSSPVFGLRELNKRFDAVEQGNLYVIAVFLHPMYKARWCKFSSDSLMERKTEDLVTQVMTEVKLTPESPVLIICHV